VPAEAVSRSSLVVDERNQYEDARVARRARVSEHVPNIVQVSQHIYTRSSIAELGKATVCSEKKMSREGIGLEVKREVNQANGPSRIHQNTFIDFAYLLTGTTLQRQGNNNIFIGRSLR